MNEVNRSLNRAAGYKCWALPFSLSNNQPPAHFVVYGRITSVCHRANGTRRLTEVLTCM